MENIIEPNEYFDFTKLSLAKPIAVPGGAYFTKIENNHKTLYIQTTKSLTKQGFVKSGKKYYCDLMFDKYSEQTINWFENLEQKCQKLIFEKNKDWFENSLEEEDVSSAFNSIMRVFKSGKYYIIRCNIKNNHLGIPYVKIYDEKDHPLSLSDVTSETNIVSILEIQGIRFTTTNFQFEIELKQVVVLEEEPLFDKCLIKINKTPVSVESNSIKNNTVTFSMKEDDIDFYATNNIINEIPDYLDNDKHDLDLDLEFNETNILVNPTDNINTLLVNSEDLLSEDKQNEDILSEDILSEDILREDKQNEDILREDIHSEDVDNVHIDFEELPEEPIVSNDLKEFDLVVNTPETIQLKKPNQVYFELYNKAREKAKSAKKNAILAYLEAKNIKKTYMLENMQNQNSDTEDIDAEIDDVSESDLEGM